ncbi:tape measure domain-containing protein [Chitinophaga dinghuensis]|uniref:Tape measure domain-containing protein n=1 Tax=Chitinophaga dinghuensis TaxID=1539050 RepID=A0A327VNX6_9BACT|nr:tape measure protein [Chitinophaga dinghuensis]RAJ75533.1 tape measure domain-containing protein [Chitinophaga dinghuensis]
MSDISVEFQQLTRLAVVISPTISTLSQLGNQGGGGRAVEGLMSVARSATMVSTALKSLHDNAGKNPCPCPPPCPCDCKDGDPSKKAAPAAPEQNEFITKMTGILGQLANKVWELTKTKQQQEITMKMAFGKAEGSGMLEELEKMQTLTPLKVDALMPGAVALKNFGMATKDIIPMMYMLGDVSGGNAEKFKTLTDTFVKIQESGKLTAETFGTLKAAGLDPIDLISQKSGISVTTLKKRMDEGRITVDMVRDAFQLATSECGNFNGVLDDQANTINGRWSIVTSKVENTLTTLAGIIGPVAGVFLDFVDAIVTMEPEAWAFASGLTGIIIGMNAAAIGGAGVAFVMNNVRTAIDFTKNAFNALGVAFKANPYAMGLMILMAIAGILTYCYKKFEGFRALVDGLSAGIVAFGRLLKDFVIDYIVTIIDLFKGVGKVLGHIFKGEFTEAITAAKETKDQFGNNLKKGISNITQNGMKVVDAYQEANKASREQFKKEQELAKKQKDGQRNGGTVVTPDYGTLKNDLPAEPKNRAENINNNGPRSIVINIGKQIEKLEVHALSAKEGVEEMGNLVREEMRRVLLSLNAMPVN